MIYIYSNTLETVNVIPGHIGVQENEPARARLISVLDPTLCPEVLPGTSSKTDLSAPGQLVFEDNEVEFETYGRM